MHCRVLWWRPGLVVSLYIDHSQCSGHEFVLASIPDCYACTRLPVPGEVHARKGEPQAPKWTARRPHSGIWLGQNPSCVNIRLLNAL